MTDKPQTTKRKIIEEFLDKIKKFRIETHEVLLMSDVRRALREMSND